LYRDHFQLYFGIAFRAYLWVLLPIYGWAKFSANSALISRLAFSELSERPETVTQARRHINPRMWNFLFAGILMILILWAYLLCFNILFGMVFALLTPFMLENVLIDFMLEPDPVKIGIFGLLMLGIFIAWIFGYIWLYSRLSIVELPLALENNVDASSTIGRSWRLTKGFVLRLVGIFFITYLITIITIGPVALVIGWILQAFFIMTVLSDSGFLSLLYFFFQMAFILGIAAFSHPFWQAIKAVIYYDIRSRREGMNLQLRDSLSRSQ